MLTLKHPDFARTSREDVEVFVERQKPLHRDAGNDVWWENHTIVFFRTDPRGVYNKDGAFHNGKWGFKNLVPVGDDGTWRIDYRNVKRSKRTAG